MFRKTLLVVIVSLFIFGVNKLVFAQAHTEYEHGTTETAEQAGTQVAVNAGNKICPVSGERVGQEGMEPVIYEYEGKVYNFCCEMCIDEFKKDPQKYIKKVKEELQAEAKKESAQSESETEMTQGSETMPEGMHQGHHH